MHTLIEGLLIIEVLMILLWVIGTLKKDVSIVDIFWGLGFVILAWYYHFKGAGNTLPVILVTIWGLRLAAHIGLRNLGKPEDRRYTEMRKGRKKFALWSLFFVFLFQGALLTTIAVPLHFMQTSPWVWSYGTVLGVLLWTIGFFFEAVGDEQLRRFKSDLLNKGKVLDKGLWRYTRHPNYFGDACLWSGYFLMSWALSGHWWLVYSPLLMTYFLLKVSGVSLLEKDISGRRPEYQNYIKNTSTFFPWFPKK